MTVHIKTDNEIIKALERCVDGSGKGIIQAAIDLITRQQAEIERLQKELEDKQFRCDSCDRIALTPSEHRFCVKQAKSEARKEFAERLMNKADVVPVDAFNYKYIISAVEIDELVKELEEGGEQE